METIRHWQAFSVSEAFEKTGSAQKGLSDSEAVKRQLSSGFNELVEGKKKSAFAMFISQFEDTMILVLLAASALSAFLGHVVDAIAIAVILVLNAIIGFVQEYRAEKAIDALKKMVSPQARVFRDGVERKVAARELVQGDVIILGEGDLIPSDARLIESFALECDEAILTGESMPVKKDYSKVCPESALLAERPNLVFMGTYVSRGRAKAIVAETGMRSEIGKIATLVSEVKEEQTPLQKQLEQMGKQLAVTALAVSLLIFVTGVLRGVNALEMFLLSVSLAVAAIPEGLPAVVTITLAIAVQRMARKNAIMRKLSAVEALGSTSVICSDKTGTLTKNEMTVRKVYVATGDFDLTGSGYSLEGGFVQGNQKVSPLKNEELFLLLKTAVLCNSSLIEPAGNSADVLGDPTEGCLLVMACKAGIDCQELRQENHLEFEIPFDSSRKMMTTLNSSASGTCSYSKGAPEVILEKCTSYLERGQIRPLTAEKKRLFLAKNEEFASQAMRVLAFAYVENFSKSIAEEGLTFLGLVGINDPPRPEAKHAIKQCQDANIRVIMITGDNPLTAKAIGVELGLLSFEDKVLTGRDLASLSKEELLAASKSTNVYARVSPEHKLKLVTLLKEQGYVVAMTGDGVNDAPAIKSADIGVGMGITGTDVTKEASDMIITDDNFASIVSAVEQGRIVYDNIIKAVKYLLACNFGELLVIFLAVIAGMPSPLTAIQILWMNLVTDSFPALALSVENKALDVMKRPPRPPGEKILSRNRLASILAGGLFMAVLTLVPYYYLLSHESLAVARTIAFNTLVLQQLMFAFASRSSKYSVFKLGFFSNKYLLAAVGFGIVLQLAVTNIPFLQDIFQTTTLDLSHWLIVVIAACSILAVSEGAKLFIKK